jgi:hypothetical protein
MKYLLSLLLLISFTVSAQDTVTIIHKAYKTTYSKSKHYPVKVEWWLTKAMLDCTVKVKRTDNFGPDPKLPQYTNLATDGTTVNFFAYTTGQSTAFGGTIATVAGEVAYSLQPTDISRGDFEDRGSDLPIPEIELELKSEPIVAKTRKLKAIWTPELAQDLNAYHSVDAEAELTQMLSEYISL